MTMSLYGHLAKPSRIRYLANVAGIDAVTDAKTFSLVSGRQQLTPAAKLAALELFKRSAYIETNTLGGQVLSLTGQLAAAGALNVQDRINGREAKQFALVSITALEKFAFNLDNTAVKDIFVTLVADPATIDVVAAPGTDMAVYEMAPAAVNTASSSSGGGGVLLFAAAAAIALAFVAMGSKKSAPARMANPTRAYNGHFNGEHQRYDANCAECQGL